MYNIGQEVLDVASGLASIFLSGSWGLSCFMLARNADTPVFFSFVSVLDALKKISKLKIPNVSTFGKDLPFAITLKFVTKFTFFDVLDQLEQINLNQIHLTNKVSK